MVTFEEIGEMLDKIALELPKDFFRDLNGGVYLSPDIKYHPESKNNDLYIMGEYHNSYHFGRHIMIYYGSFINVYGNSSSEYQEEKLKAILVHEFTHHLESKAGEKYLEIEDAIEIAAYKKRYEE